MPGNEVEGVEGGESGAGAASDSARSVMQTCPDGRQPRKETAASSDEQGLLNQLFSVMSDVRGQGQVHGGQGRASEKGDM